MDIRKRKLKGYIALSVLIIVCMLLASAMSFFMPNNNAEAIKAENMSSQSTNLGEMLLDDYKNSGNGKAFNVAVFWDLISQISKGSVNATNQSGLSDLGKTEINSANFRSYNDGNDVVVTIGGKQWIATYLSQNGEKEPILTLWLADNETTMQWHTVGDANYNKSGAYPCNMYGTSWMRASILNNGGVYATTYNAASLTPVTQSSKSEWAIYTMTKDQGVTGSLTEFIEVPDNMSWQHDQRSYTYVTSSAYVGTYYAAEYLNNDSLDVGGTGANGSYLKKTNYSAWGQDKLWLPSVTETGVSGEEGIWKASGSTRGCSSYSWLRSSSIDTYHVALRINESSVSRTQVIQTNGLRPAFHLNLAEVVKSLALANPQTKGDVKQYYSPIR